MKEDFITVRFQEDTGLECRSAILIPEEAAIEAGNIRTLTANPTAHSKHEFHALAQMALFQFQEGELKVEAVHGAFNIQWKNEKETMTAGVVVLLDSQGTLHLISNSGRNVNKLLQLAHRFCTRWIRLDI